MLQNITINKKDFKEYFPIETMQYKLLHPFKTTDLLGKFDVMVNGKKIDVPFLPKSNNPKDIAKTIDMIVGSESFRNQLYDKELEYVKQVSDPKKAAKWWDELFVQLVNRHKTIRKNSPPWKIKLRMWNFLISNRLYWNKLKKIGS